MRTRDAQETTSPRIVLRTATGSPIKQSSSPHKGGDNKGELGGLGGFRAHGEQERDPRANMREKCKERKGRREGRGKEGRAREEGTGGKSNGFAVSGTVELDGIEEVLPDDIRRCAKG